MADDWKNKFKNSVTDLVDKRDSDTFRVFTFGDNQKNNVMESTGYDQSTPLLPDMSAPKSDLTLEELQEILDDN